MKNKYGYFDDEKREYVITRPDTPLPWLNYLGQDDLFGLCTNTAGGYTFWRDARLRRLTRYRYNNMPMDSGGRYLYINDNGTVWNPCWKPVKTKLDNYECRHGLGYTRIIGEKNGLEVEMLFFVPPGRTLEIWKTTVRNKSGRKKDIKLFSFVEFCLFEALNDMTNYQRTYSIGETDVEDSVIYHKTEYRERRDHYVLFGCTHPIDGCDTSRDEFVGVHNGLHDANVPFKGNCTQKSACGWNPIGSHQINLSLADGEQESFAFVLAYLDQGDLPKFEKPMVLNKQKGREIMAQYADMKAVDQAFDSISRRWQELLASYQVQCPDEHLQRMVNIWNAYQCMATFNLSRSASLFESGIGRGMGFRDSNQDLLGFMHMIPARARQRILDLAGTQLSDGTCFHQYQPLTKKGNKEMGGGFNDDPLWLVLSTCAYIKETGDKTILDEPISYEDTEDITTTLLDHLETSIAYTMRNRGPHGLPLIGHADWNDCLNLNCFSTDPDESFQTAGDSKGDTAESLMIAGQFLSATREMTDLYNWLGRQDKAARMSEHYTQMLEAVESHGWDGQWYKRAFDAYGNPVGSKENQEGKIYIESQGWCVLGGAGLDNGRAEQALRSVNEHLFTEDGVILQQPAYTEYHLELGEVTSYPPGYKENAAIFVHNNTWIQLAWCLLGQGEEALKYYLSVCPSTKQDKIDIYRCEPYVYAQMIAGRDAQTPGEAKNSWLTGTAAWSFVSATQGILGIKPDYQGLRIDPCIPRSWKEYSVDRCFRGVDYRITVKNPSGVCKGVEKITANGSPIDGNIIPHQQSHKEVVVEVIMG